MVINNLMFRKENTKHEASAFDKYLINKVCSSHVSLQEKKVLFDNIQTSPLHKYWFFNRFRWLMTYGDEINIDLGIKFCAICMTGAVTDVVQTHMESICNLLGMRNIHDTDRKMTREDIEGSMEELRPHLKSLRTLLKSRESDKKDDFRSVTDTLRTFFKKLYGIKFDNLDRNKQMKCSTGPRQKKAVLFSLSYIDDFSRCLYTCGHR